MALLPAILLLPAALSLAATFAYCFFFRGLLRRHGGGDDNDGVLPTAKVIDVVEKPEEKLKSISSVDRYTWEDIRRMTGGFSTSAVIGHGGFSTVYLAKLPDSTMGAVKVHHGSERLRCAFPRELEVLLRVRHENIVTLLGYSDDQEQGSLVFEYVPDGTLHDRLYGSPALRWCDRMSVAFQLANALHYLHESCDLPVVHNDVKPSNVLLADGEGLRVKLCDFGSATMGFSAAISPARQAAMVGSPGYVDPHYVRTGMVSKKGDVYGYGVLVKELMTGREAFSGNNGRRTEAAEGWVVDGRLGKEYVEEEAETMADVARWCMGEQPSMRPSMKEVVEVMKEKVRSCAFGGRSDRGRGRRKV